MGDTVGLRRISNRYLAVYVAKTLKGKEAVNMSVDREYPSVTRLAVNHTSGGCNSLHCEDPARYLVVVGHMMLRLCEDCSKALRTNLRMARSR